MSWHLDMPERRTTVNKGKLFLTVEALWLLVELVAESPLRCSDTHAHCKQNSSKRKQKSSHRKQKIYHEQLQAKMLKCKQEASNTIELKA